MSRPELRILPQPSRLEESLEQFMLDRQAMRATAKTLEHYRYTTGSFVAWLTERGVRQVGEIQPAHVRRYLVSLQERGLRDTSQHAHARGVKTWLRWLVAEGELAESPMARVAMPRLEQRIPAPFTPEDIQALLAACDPRTPAGARDRAIVATLLDTGLRAAELCSLRIGDVDMATGLISVMGKGGKQRTVRVGAKARAAIRKMLRSRTNTGADEPLWASLEGGEWEAGPLSKSGLTSLLLRLGRRAGVEPSGAHRYRRTFALMMLRAGCDLHSLRVLMGHSGLAVLQRYLALGAEDVERAHAAYSPADRML